MVDSLRIRNFNYMNKFFGTFLIKLDEQEYINEIFNQYSDDIYYIGISLEILDKIIKFGFYENGIIRILSKVEEESEIVDEIQKILFMRDF